MKSSAVLLLMVGFLAAVSGCASTAPHGRVSGAPTASGAHEPVSDAWQFELTPYLWAAGLEGDVTVGGITASADASFADMVGSLDGGVSAHFEARKGRGSLFADGLYLRLSDDASGPLGFSKADIEIEQFMAELGAAYRFWEEPIGESDKGAGRPRTVSTEVLGGARYTYLAGDLDLKVGPASTSLHGSKDWVDPFVGARVKCDLSEKLELTLRGDVGGFGVGSDLTWNVIGGLGCRLSESGVLRAGYRVLDIDYDGGGFVYDVQMAGPWLAFTWQF